MRVLVFVGTGAAGVCLSLSVAGEDIGRAMLQATTEGLRRRIVENPEIRAIARRVDPSIDGARR